MTESSYKVRVMGCIAVVQLLVLLIFNFWPTPDQPNNDEEIVFSENQTAVEDIVITRQESSPPPPPVPQIPVPVPNDSIIEEEIVFKDIDITEYSDSLSTSKIGTVGDSDRIASNPQQPPGLIKIVEANTTESAKKANVKARVWVNFLVAKDGKVEEATIASIELYDNDEKKFKPVQTLGYGLTGEILTAALQWKFRPARDNGEPVRAIVKHAFSFGI